MDQKTNESVMNEIRADREQIATARKRTLQNFGYMSTEPLHVHFLKVVWM